MALSWTQDRIGPLVRYAEDAAIVMQAIAKPDGRDMSVSDIPFNWNANLDIRKLRVGYIKESFDIVTDADTKTRNQKVLDTLTSLGVTKLIPITVPENVTQNRSIGGLGVESTAYFDEFRRGGKMNGSRGGGGAGSRLTSAVEYLQSQRVRMMMMIDLAKATEAVDVYLVAGGPGGGGGGAAAAGRGTPPAAGEAAAAPPPAGRGGRGGRGDTAPPATGANAHFAMANLACYPAMNLPNGFNANGSPSSCTIYGRPFNEMEIIAVAKAYQDAAGFHLKKPTKLDS
jgi:Asp-tRNA(Asn)/Glu-tRNA(Gln) amidotransferase A subunit family amidase